MSATWDVLEGNWKMFKGQIKEKWGKLTDQDIDVIAGKKDQLIGKLQTQYGYAKSDAEREVMDFMKGCNGNDASCSDDRSNVTR